MIEKILKDGTKVMTYPMSIPQQLMYFMSVQYGSGYPINNIGMGYYLQWDMDFEQMRAAVEEAVARCDTMRLRFLPDDNYKLVQYVNPTSEMQIETWDLRELTPENAHEKLLQIARGPVPMFDCELHQIALVRLCDGYSGIFMKLQHLAMDAYAAKVFLHDILAIYAHKTSGSAYPKPMRAYLPVLLQELSYVKSEQYAADRAFWFDSLAQTEEPIFTDYLLESRLVQQRKENPSQRYADIHAGSPAADISVYDMTAAQTAAFLHMCDERGLSVCAAVSMAVRTALSVFNENEEDVSFKMIVNRRGSLAEKKSGGIRLNFFPMRSIIKPEATFVQAVSQIACVQAQIYEHCSLSFMEMLMLRHKSMPQGAKADSTYDSVGLSYQPLMPVNTFGNKTARSVWYNNGATMIPMYLTVLHRAVDNGLSFVFEYRKTPDPTYDLSVFYDRIRRTLLAATENPDVAVGELLEKLAVTKEEREGKKNGKVDCHS